jgi:hypothetical protein
MLLAVHGAWELLASNTTCSGHREEAGYRASLPGAHSRLERSGAFHPQRPRQTAHAATAGATATSQAQRWTDGGICQPSHVHNQPGMCESFQETWERCLHSRHQAAAQPPSTRYAVLRHLVLYNSKVF